MPLAWSCSRSSTAPDPVASAPPVPNRVRPDPLPDVVVIVLDAARASNFGASEYHRDTTPVLDELAAGGFVFRRAFSECPNIVPTILGLVDAKPEEVVRGIDLPEKRPSSDDRVIFQRHTNGREFAVHSRNRVWPACEEGTDSTPSVMASTVPRSSSPRRISALSVRWAIFGEAPASSGAEPRRFPAVANQLGV